jgi:polyisoprenoid-binding protein YceI
MKFLKLSLVVMLSIFLNQEIIAQAKKINLETSNIVWVGKKITGSHFGNINFIAGSLQFEGDKLKGGQFQVDMTSITVSDLKAGSGKEKLEGHLKADDFFGTDKHPVSNLVFKTIKDNGDGNYLITADLTIKNITKPVTFDLAVSNGRARTSFMVDRTKYGIEYKSSSIFSSLGDAAIHDNFELTVTLFY